MAHSLNSRVSLDQRFLAMGSESIAGSGDSLAYSNNYKTIFMECGAQMSYWMGWGVNCLQEIVFNEIMDGKSKKITTIMQQFKVTFFSKSFMTWQ